MPDFLYAGRIHPVLFVIWTLSVAAASFAVIRSIRHARSAKAKAPGVLPVLVVPWAALTLTILAFTVGHGHPLAQYNDSASFVSVGIWFRVWPMLVLGGLASSIVSFVGLARSLSPSGYAGTWGIAMVANLITIPCVFGNFPDA